MSLAQCSVQHTLSIPHTNSANKSEKSQSGHDILCEVRLAGTVESSCGAVLLVVVRRLGHAAQVISASPYGQSIYLYSPSDRHLEGCIWREWYMSMSHRFDVDQHVSVVGKSLSLGSSQPSRRVHHKQERA